jgi:uncharacterized membrane protein YphA (DoxX/SURF4 family)
MKKINTLYWVFTGLFIALTLVSAIPDIMRIPEVVARITKLGYPAYFVPFIGAVKVLGTVAIVIPGFPRIKEWAYAGFVFDLVGAEYSGIAAGDPTNPLTAVMVGLILLAGSYFSYHKKTTFIDITGASEK